MRQATAEVEQLRQQTLACGYQRGLIDAATVVADFFNQRQQLSGSLQQSVAEKARELLTHVVSQPELIVALLDDWLRVQSVTGDEPPLQILLPAGAGAVAVGLKQKLAESWAGRYEIAYHADNRFLMKYHHQVAEFDGEQFIQQGVKALLSTLEWSTACDGLSEEGLRQLTQMFPFPAGSTPTYEEV